MLCFETFCIDQPTLKCFFQPSNTDALEAAGITVWVDVSGLEAGVDFLSKIGEAIIDCKVS